MQSLIFCIQQNTEVGYLLNLWYILLLLRTHLLNAHAVKKHYVHVKTTETECDTVVEKRNLLEKVHNELKMLIFKILLIPSAAIGG